MLKIVGLYMSLSVRCSLIISHDFVLYSSACIWIFSFNWWVAPSREYTPRCCSCRSLTFLPSFRLSHRVATHTKISAEPDSMNSLILGFIFSQLLPPIYIWFLYRIIKRNLWDVECTAESRLEKHLHNYDFFFITRLRCAAIQMRFLLPWLYILYKNNIPSAWLKN